jgi:8-oxo-dGTP diphosphatase
MKNEFFEASIVIPLRKGKALFGFKKYKIGVRRWNGYGGKSEKDDATIEDTAIRELQQEVGIFANKSDLIKMAIAIFHNTRADGTTFTAKVHIYLLYVWSGKPKSSREMRTPTYFPLRKLPLRNMMLADRIWLPRILAGEKILIEGEYGPFQKTLFSLQITGNGNTI